MDAANMVCDVIAHSALCFFLSDHFSSFESRKRVKILRTKSPTSVRPCRKRSCNVRWALKGRDCEASVSISHPSAALPVCLPVDFSSSIPTERKFCRSGLRCVLHYVDLWIGQLLQFCWSKIEYFSINRQLFYSFTSVPLRICVYVIMTIDSKFCFPWALSPMKGARCNVWSATYSDFFNEI